MKNKENLRMFLIFALAGAVSSIVCFFMDKRCALICFIFTVTVITVFAVCMKKRYDKINELNNYLSLVCSGNFDLDVSDNTEGELSILKNNLYKVIVLLRSSNDELKKDKLYLADSLADISHQLKTPLTSVMVITDLIKNETDSKKRNNFVEIIENQCEKMKWLIATLLKLSKLDAGTADFKKESLSIKSIIGESIRPFLITLDLKAIRLVENIEDFIFEGDGNWTVEAIKNIVKNCIEHMGQGGTLEISTSQTAIYNMIEIKDNGSGIAKEDLPYIFNRFYHGKNAPPDSVGIGLALSKAIVQNEKGEITVKSGEGAGSAFTIKFFKSVV